MLVDLVSPQPNCIPRSYTKPYSYIGKTTKFLKDINEDSIAHVIIIFYY